MSVVAVIPARGGSRGVLRKNLQPIDGIPLVGWSIRAALAAKLVDAVYVSTEDAEIAEVAARFGAVVIERPVKLATDEATGVAVLQHAVDWMSNTDGRGAVLLLQCTSPFTSSADIDGAVALYEADANTDTVVTVCRDHSHQVRETSRGVDWISFDPSRNFRRQDQPPTFRLAGGIYVVRLHELRGASSLFAGCTRLYEIPADRAVDIDTALDLQVAKAIARYRDQWIVVGSSTSARRGLEMARSLHPAAKTITTNYGHELFEGGDRPDYYHLHDSVACLKHKQAARELAARGTRTITVARKSERAIADRGVEWFDEFLALDSDGREDRFRPGHYAPCMLSGMMILQYALNHGARGVHLVGMQGYGKGPPHYFNGAPGLAAEKGRRLTETLIRPFVQSCIDRLPDVEFTFYGEPSYSVSGRNVRCRK